MRGAQRFTRSATLLAVLVLVTGGALATPARASGGTLGSGGYRATVYRTAHDIPHIVADDLGSLGFGYGYAFAQDNVCTLASDVVTLEARRSRFFGPDAIEPDAGVTNLTSDFYYQWLKDQGTVDRLLRQPPPVGPSNEARTLVQGYADGFNAYLHDVGVANLPDPTCRGQAWVRPITAWDVWARQYQVALIKSSGFLFPFMESAQPPASGAAVRSLAISARAVQSLLQLPAAAGSNAVGLGAEATQGGSGMLLANPHFAWTGTNRFYQVQLTIPGELDVAGAGLYGMPVVVIGHNQRTAWSHTVSIDQRFTLYQLRLAPADPTEYLFDGRPTGMTRQVVSVEVRAPAGGFERRQHTFYGTRFGPALAVPAAGLSWTPDTAYAVKDANAGNLRLVDQWLALGRARGVADLRASEARVQGLPWVNTVAADDGGHSLYLDISATPHVTDRQVADCVDTPLAQALLAQPGGLFLLDGSRRACDWGSDPDAVEPGLYGPGSQPALLRADFVENSNDSYWLTNPMAPLTGFPRIMGDVGTERGPRMRLELLEIEARLAGRDGRAGSRYSLDQLLADGFDDRSYFGELTRDDAVAMCRRVPRVTMSDGTVADVSPACPVLAAWDLHMNLDSRGAELYQEFLRGVQLFPGGPWKHPFSAADPIGTPNTLDTSNVAVQQALAAAVGELEAAHVPLDAPLGAVQFEPAANGERIPMHGGRGEDSGVLNVIESPVPPPNGLYSPVVDGSSFVMATEFTGHGPRTRTILTYSESANPASPFANDQTRLFSAKEWLQERFTRSEVLADPALTTLSLSAPRPPVVLGAPR